MTDLIYHPISSRKLNRKLKVRPKRIKIETFQECLTSQNKKNTTTNWDALEPSKEIIKTDLLLHQQYGLGWLYQRENCKELQPFWVEEEENSEQGGKLYRNLLNNNKRVKERPTLKGGVFADDMGLGKTLTLLSLISTDYTSYTKLNSSDLSSSLTNTINGVVDNENLEEGDDDDKQRSGLFVGGKNFRIRKHSNEVLGTHKKLKLATELGENCLRESSKRITLVVCPPAVLSTWKRQLDEHTKPGSLKLFVYNHVLPNGNGIKVEELRKYDIVLTTYDTVEWYLRWYTNSALICMEWYRVILDDAHVLRKWNLKEQRLLHLKAHCRWVVTGMPIVSTSYDMYYAMAFLRFYPFSVKFRWESLVQRPLKNGKVPLSHLQDLMAIISLRRLKTDCLVKLPPKAVETFFLELSDEERVRYDQKELDCQEAVQTYIRLGRAVAEYSSILATVQRLRELCNDVASCPSEMLLYVNVADVSKNPELLQKLFSKLREDYLDCPICISPLLDIVITCCGHIFCKKCILKALKHKNGRCPMCRHHLSKSDLFSSPSVDPRNDESENNNVAVSLPGRSGSITYSSKVCALLKLLVSTRNENPSAKSVVFSQFRKMLSLLLEPLKSAGFGILRLDGTTSAKRRDDVIQKFNNQDSGSPIVLLVEFKPSVSGIDLTAASRAYMLEPWLEPVVEEQAMDRLHRIGQEDMKIVRLITRNSIEERILQLHKWKNNLVKEGASAKNNMNQKQLHTEEFRIIMGLTTY
ncbi:hypothetical protein MKW92_017566 [Papaver armeniacum]|nr:hypothetical protein MKW92_017566 [Papaver armeniacum]